MGGPRIEDDGDRFGRMLGGRDPDRLDVDGPDGRVLEPPDVRVDPVAGGSYRVRLEAIEHARRMIADYRDALGAGPGAALGDPDDDGGRTPGFVQRFVNGAIWWRRDLGAHWLFGPVLDHYLATGGAGGELGAPRTDWRTARDGTGQLADFEHGTAVWRPDLGAVTLTGPVHAAWVGLGAQDWAYPYSAPIPLVSGWARVVHFRAYRAGGGTDDVSIYWSPETGAQPVYGDIRARWAALGWEESYLGFPVTAEQPWDDPESDRVGRVQHFQRGAIAWSAADRAVIEYPDRIVARSGHVGASSVGGSVELVLTSAGTFTYRGHLHNSGFAGLYCTIGSQLGFTGPDERPTFLRLKKEVEVGGTTSFDGRDEDWTDEGYDASIRILWDDLVRSGWKLDTGIKVELGAADFFQLVFAPLVGAMIGISLVFGGKPDDTVCKTSGWHTTKDGNNNTVYEAGGIRCGLRPPDDEIDDQGSPEP